MRKQLIEDSARINIYDLLKRGIVSRSRISLQPSTVITGILISSRRQTKQELSIPLYFTTTRTNFEGIRFWFRCPSCSRRVADYYCPSGNSVFLCRYCHDLAYSCQNRHRERFWECFHRFEHKQGKIKKKLENKWLRIPTKGWLINQYSELKKEADSVMNQLLPKKYRQWKDAT